MLPLRSKIVTNNFGQTMNNKFLIASALCMSMSATMNAQNPIVQTQLTTDPARPLYSFPI